MSVLRLEVDNVRENIRPLCVTNSGNLVARGLGSDSRNVYVSYDHGNNFIHIHTLPPTHTITYLFQSSSGAYIAMMPYWKDGQSHFFVGRSVNLVDWVNVKEFGTQNPWFGQGICEGAQGNIYFGEYVTYGDDYIDGEQNPDRYINREVNLFKSTDDGLTFSSVYKFTGYETRHFHVVQYDPYSDSIWIGTGDIGEENRVGFSTDGGQTFTFVDSSSQRARTTCFLFTEKYVHWGMDTSHEPAHHIRYNRQTGEIEKTSRSRYELLFGLKWEPWGILMMTNGYDVSSTDPRNSFLYLTDNEKRWITTNHFFPDELLEKSGNLWNLTKQDNQGYAYAFVLHQNIMIRMSLQPIQRKLSSRNINSKRTKNSKITKEQKRLLEFVTG